MYASNRRVFIPSIDRLARVERRHWTATEDGRRALYLVRFVDGGGGGPFLARSADLRPADYCCDGCGEWRPGTAHEHGPEGLGFCFLCSGPPAAREAWKAEQAYYAQLTAGQR